MVHSAAMHCRLLYTPGLHNRNNNHTGGGGGGDDSQWRDTERLVRGVTGSQAVSRNYKRHRSTWEIWHGSVRGQMEEQRKGPALAQQYEGRSVKKILLLEGLEGIYCI